MATPHFLMDLTPTEFDEQLQSQLGPTFTNDSPCVGCKEYQRCGSARTSCAASRRYELRGNFTIVTINTKIKGIK